MNSKLNGAIFATLGTVLGLVVGSLSVYTFAEKRIQDRATEKTAVDMRIQELKMLHQKLDSREWDSRGELRQDIRELKADFNSVRDKVLQLENKSKL